METIVDEFALEKEEIFAPDEVKLEQLVSIRESEGWSRQGEPQMITATNEKGESGLIQWVQVVMKNPQGEIPPQD